MFVKGINPKNPIHNNYIRSLGQLAFSNSSTIASRSFLSAFLPPLVNFLGDCTTTRRLYFAKPPEASQLRSLTLGRGRDLSSNQSSRRFGWATWRCCGLHTRWWGSNPGWRSSIGRLGTGARVLLSPQEGQLIHHLLIRLACRIPYGKKVSK